MITFLPKSPLEYLPPEIISHIASFLNTPALGRFLGTSKTISEKQRRFRLYDIYRNTISVKNWQNFVERQCPYLDCYRYFLDNVNHEDRSFMIGKSGEEALLIAAERGYLDILEYLVSKDVNIYTNDGEVLTNAIFKNQLEIVKYLILTDENTHRKSMVNFQNDLPIIKAVKAGNLEMIEYLISKGANLRTTNDHAIIVASMHNNLDVFRYLVKKGLNPRVNDDRPLKVASKYGCLDIVDYLLDLNANIRVINVGGLLRSAIIQEHYKLIELLLSLKGAKFFIDDDIVSTIIYRDSTVE
jgi:ankyrin repeat protein